MSQKDSTGQWMDAVNLGLPLNSSGDEHGLVVSTDGKFGMFASRRDGTLGLDICTYTLPDELKPDPVTVVTGEVGWPLPKGELTLNIEYVQSKRVEQIQISSEDGAFAHVVKLEDGEDVVMTLEGDEIGYQSRVVHEDGTDPGNSVSLDFVPENPNADGDPAFELPDVQFDTKKATLSPRSLVVLSALANHMARNPNRVLHIEGHTDNVGDAEDNLRLSQARAEAVQDHLISQDIAEDRLRVRGFGETAPKTTNATPEGRKINRRTAFRWTE
jgi:outer membrane protein OmpA-like peptidoglycan-associated protein